MVERVRQRAAAVMESKKKKKQETSYSAQFHPSGNAGYLIMMDVAN
jgi:hypothetical protein